MMLTKISSRSICAHFCVSSVAAIAHDQTLPQLALGRNYGKSTMMISTMNADNEAAWTASGYDSWNPSAFLGDNEDIEK
jgi:N-formylglutamate amidohydrolase